MGARAFVSFLLVVLTWQPTPLVGAQSLDESLSQGRALVRRGDFATAQAFYAAVAEQGDAAVAPRAVLLQARAALADGAADTAESLLQSVLTDYPGSAQEANALFTLGVVRRTAG